MSKPGITIQIVEDENIVSLDLKIQLKNFGFKIIPICSNGSEAIARAESERPDLIIMDVKLKGTVDGITAAVKIRKFHNVPIIFITGLPSDSVELDNNICKKSILIHKPIMNEDLMSSIWALIGNDQPKVAHCY